MSQWFGQSWGAPCCDPDDHVATPVFMACLHCKEPILPDAQGLMMPLVESPERCSICAVHLDCYLQRILPHGPDCPHCRGKELSNHALRCEYRQNGGDCNCVPLEEFVPSSPGVSGPGEREG